MAKPKAKRTLRASRSRKPTAQAARPAKAGANNGPASRLIDRRIRDLGGWRGETLARMRALILEADPGMVEECKWIKPTNPSGVPVWSHAGIVCTGEAYAKVVKLTFTRGTAIPDPSHLFNSSLEGNTRRAIDIREREKVAAGAFQALVKAAVAANAGTKARRPPKPVAKARPGARDAVVLLSGGNPQIAKADGDAPVQAYIAAMPGWKRGLGERLDTLIARNAPDVRKAVQWNSPFYGIDGQGWFLSFHVFSQYVKVSFFRGTSLQPVPLGGTVKSKEVRWIDIREGDALDEAQMATWIRQAAALPGWVP